MAELKREYVIPLRRKTRFAPKWRRSKKAVSVLKEFICKHMKTDNVIVCPELNHKLWANGIKNPPGKVNVVALKKKIGLEEKVIVNLIEVGVDKYLGLYEEKNATVEKEEVKPADLKSEKAIDVESVEKDDSNKEGQNLADTKTNKKLKTEKKEVKKDE